jgi:hypothetical protein
LTSLVAATAALGRRDALAACGLFGIPANLNLMSNELINAGVIALAKMPELRNVVRLSLSHTEVGDRGARALAESPHLENLEELDLSLNKVGADGLEALVSGQGLPRLTRLNVGSKPLKDAGLERLAALPGAARLTSLVLWRAMAGDAGLEALAQSPHLTGLRHLDLGGLPMSRSPVSREAVQRLLDSPNLPRLGLLNLAHIFPAEAFEVLRLEAARRGITLSEY